MSVRHSLRVGCFLSACLCGHLAHHACRTPCVRRIYDALPLESRTGRVQLLLPDGPPSSSTSSSGSNSGSSSGGGVITSHLPPGGISSSRRRRHTMFTTSSSSGSRLGDDSALFGDGGCLNAAVLHLAATGDQGFGRRLKLGGPLLAQVRVV